MLSQPRLIKNEQSNSKPINLKSQASGSARFLLGLNNRVTHMDKRLKRLEATSDHVLRHHVGYKELTLTFVLAVLVFTSITLALRDGTFNATIANNTGQEGNDIQSLNNHPELKKALLNLVEKNQTSKQEAVTPNFKWPLEKQLDASDIVYVQHKHGIELNAKLGDPIVAIESGKVLYSGNSINSYGNLILIQHPNNIISVYGNNYSNYVAEGENINKGQLIAAVGEGNGKQPRLYFEVRYQGKAQDPFLYFK